MECTSGRPTDVTNSEEHNKSKRKNFSIFEALSNFFDSYRFFESLSTPELITTTGTSTEYTVEDRDTAAEKNVGSSKRWTCNTCKYSFDSLHDQRAHFKSDFHLLNVKLSITGRLTIKEDEFDECPNYLVKDYDIISSSEDEDRKYFGSQSDLTKGLLENKKQRICIRLPPGETISFWKCLLLGDCEKIVFEHDLSGIMKDDDTPCVTVREVAERLVNVIHEPRNNKCLRVMLLVSGGRFAGCVFDGNSIVAHKTFHRYVIRAKAGKKQSSEDGGGKIAHSAGASIRRHNELVLKKDIRKLLSEWEPYFDQSACVFIHAPSHNRQLLFDGQNPCFSCQRIAIRHIPLTVGRSTFKEAQRLYKILTKISTEPDEEKPPIFKEDSTSTFDKENMRNNFVNGNISEDSSVENVERIHIPLPLHEAAKAGNAEKVLELLEQGCDPCVIDEMGHTPYKVASKKEVRNTFRRFMALNPNKWDWQAAKVPCALTKEMEESQNSKQAKKDAKRKARAKELKRQRKSIEKKAQEGIPCRCSHLGTHWISSTRVAGALVLVIGSLMVVAFGHMGRGRTRKNAR